MDSNIGTFTTDFQAVYFDKSGKHELYRKWVALVDTMDAGDVGVQGYLLMSISIVGPGDKVVYHDLGKELADSEVPTLNGPSPHHPINPSPHHPITPSY